LSFAIRQFFPQQIDALLEFTDMLIEHKYGNYAEAAFSSDTDKQLIVCCAK